MKTRLLLLRGLAAALAACFLAIPVHGEPALPQVVNGQASFAQQGAVFSITNTPGAIINWQNFSIAPGEVTRFIQQSSDSAVLNRVVGQDPSRILGTLQSNGQVFLINPNGIVFGKDARVDVAGLTASTLDIANSDFAGGGRKFSAGATAGAIVNGGSITTARGGAVYLIATSVENSGVITTPDGSALLAAGRSVQLVDARNPAVRVIVSAPQDAALNLGRMVAEGGHIGIYGALVRQGGVANADSARIGANGKIILKASGDALLEGSSVTSALGAGKGGEIHVLGQRVGMTGTARIDASGAAGGGTVLLGGDFGGANPLLPHARQTLFGKEASIRADAQGEGDGGKVVLWSDGSTRALGRISARGAGGGAGGLVETSGSHLAVGGLRVDTGTPLGKTGTWLLDPFDIIITAAAPDVAWSAVDEFIDDPSDNPTYIATAVFASLDVNANVVLQARRDITIEADLVRPLGTKGSTTLEAGNNINVDSAVNTGGGALGLTANAGAYASGNGNVNLRAAVNTGAAPLFASGRQVWVDAAATVRGGGIDLQAGGGVYMVAGSQLQSGSAINIRADRVGLAGAIGPLEGQLPSVSIQPLGSERQILINDVDPSEGMALQLAPLDLATISAASIRIGGPQNLGDIQVGSPLLLGSGITSNLVLETRGAVLVDAPVNLQPASGSRLTIDAGTVTVNANRTVAADHLIVRGDGMTIDGTLSNADQPGGTITLAPMSASTSTRVGGESITGAPGQLVLDAAELARVASNHLTIGGNEGHSGAVVVADLIALTGNAGDPTPAAERTVRVLAGNGQLLVEGFLNTDRALSLQGRHIATAPDARIGAPSLVLTASEGIGSKDAPLRTSTGSLSATNFRPGGTAPINIFNDVLLSLHSVEQAGAGNAGDITILNQGGMTLMSRETVRTGGSGAVSLKTRSPLTIGGTITTGSGAVTLEAGNGGDLMLTESGSVDAGGNVALTGGTIFHRGAVKSRGGEITTVGPVIGGGTFEEPGAGPAPPDEPNEPTTPTAPTAPDEPTLEQCIAQPAFSGCAGVLPTVDQCVARPGASGCTVVLPTVPQCTATPTAAGCSVVLPTLVQCTSAPATAGCAVVLPTVSQCTTAPTTAGCSVVLPTLSQCTTAPTTAGCSAVLPTIGQCTTAPTTAGCSAVLPTIGQCTTAPTTAGCSAVLPTIGQCTTAPTTAGCSAVLPTIGQCTTAPTTAGCSAVLPTMGQCTTAPTTAGCSAVLPTIAQCTAAPVAPGCSVVLPTIAQCTAAPAMAGCAVVLPTIGQCSLAPASPGCSVVLPTLAQCSASPVIPGCMVVLPSLVQCIGNPVQPGCGAVLPGIAACTATPAAPGCAVVLPSLSSCVAAPASAGCSAVLPTLAQCVDAPGLQGCSAVLPPLERCVADPSAPGCVVVVPPRQTPVGSPVQDVVATTVNVLNGAGERIAVQTQARAPFSAPLGRSPRDAAADSGSADLAGRKPANERAGSVPAGESNHEGGKRGKLVKTYCN